MDANDKRPPPLPHRTSFRLSSRRIALSYRIIYVAQLNHNQTRAPKPRRHSETNRQAYILAIYISLTQRHARNNWNATSIVRTALILKHEDAYDKPRSQKSLRPHNIIYKPRPARSHNKLGYVERKTRTINTIIKRLDMHEHKTDANIIIARAVFLSDVFSPMA